MRTRPKFASEVRTYQVPFGNQPEFDLPVPSTITAIDALTSTPGGVGALVISGAAIGPSGSDVFFVATGGVEGTRYLIDCRVTLDTGTKLRQPGVISVTPIVLPTV